MDHLFVTSPSLVHLFDTCCKLQLVARCIPKYCIYLMDGISRPSMTFFYAPRAMSSHCPSILTRFEGSDLQRDAEMSRSLQWQRRHGLLLRASDS